MVLFNNINVNQRVEVLRQGEIYAGTVLYKGRIHGEAGDWVGLELDLPGYCSINYCITRNYSKLHIASPKHIVQFLMIILLTLPTYGIIRF